MTASICECGHLRIAHRGGWACRECGCATFARDNGDGLCECGHPAHAVGPHCTLAQGACWCQVGA